MSLEPFALAKDRIPGTRHHEGADFFILMKISLAISVILMYIDIKMKVPKAKHPQTVTIEVTLPILPGSISTAWSTCGKPQCACHQDPEKRHGPYYRWTGVLQGKRTTKTLSREEALACQDRIRNYRVLQKSLEALLRQALEDAPWAHREGQ